VFATGLWTALLALTLSGCWLQPGFGPQHDRYNRFESNLTVANVGSLAQRWSVGLQAASLSEPVISGGRAFLTTRGVSGDSGSSVQAFRLSSGAHIWEHELEGGVSFSLAGSATFSGDALWASHIDFTASPCPFRLTGIDPDDGTPVDSTPVNYPVSGIVTSGSAAVYTESTACLVEGSPSTLVVRDTATQATQWTAALPGPASGPTISAGVIYVTSAGQVYAFDAAGCGAATCEPLWVRDGDDAGVINGHTFDIRQHRVDLGHGVVAESSVLEVAAADTGELLWSASYTGGDPFAGMGRGQITGIAVDDDTVYVAAWRDPSTPGDAIGTLDAYPVAGCGAATCAPAWRGTLPSSPRGSIAVAGGVVYAMVGNVTGTLVAFATAGCGATTCAPLTSVPVPGAPDNISVGEGTVLVTSLGDSGTKHLTAYRAP
jgi:hypothetical protein